MTVFSVLDQGPVRHNGGARAALCDAVAVAREIDELGFARYWVAEHHGTASRAISAPEVLIGHIAAATTRLRVGAGGMMLPNHIPLHVAEQFRTLGALYPGRIDLGVGRANGSNNATTAAALRNGPDDAKGFEEQLQLLLAFGGKRPFPPGHPTEIQVMPDDVPSPPVFLLGSSIGSAEVAARLGLSYALSAGFRDPAVATEALLRYRDEFTPVRDGDQPHAIVVVRAWVGENDTDAERLAASERLANVQQLAGNPRPLLPADVAARHQPTESERRAGAPLDLRSDVVGGPDLARDRLLTLAKESGADEIMVVSNTYSAEDRIASFRRLAAALELSG